MAGLTVPTAPPLATVANVELMHAGTWNLSTGPANFTTDDLYSAVAALDCPAVRRPVLKLGHQEPDPGADGMRWDGEPAVGWVANLAVAEGGRTLVGDYTGMPSWLGGEVLASAYPDRSIEGWYDFRCQLGHTHPFVLTAVALLGVTAPGVGTLQSLQDVAALYGVAAAQPSIESGTPFRIHAAQEVRVPNPSATKVAAAVTSEDVRRAFYASEYGKGWDIWITEMQLGPDTQLIICDDANGSISRVPVVIGDGDGEDAVSFGEPVKVVIRYEDAPTTVAAAAGQPEPVRYASRAESRPGERPIAQLDLGGTLPAANTSGTTERVLTAAQWAELAANGSLPPHEPLPEPDPATEPDVEPEPQDPADPAEPTATPTTEGAAQMDAALIRQALGLLPEATDEEVGAAIAAAGLAPQPEPTVEPEPQPEPALAAPVLPEGIVTIDETVLEDLRQRAEQGVAARAQQLADVRSQVLGSAVKAGKIPPARLDHYGKLYDLDPEGTKQALASLPEGLVPLADAGISGQAEDAAENFSDVDRLFSAPVPTRQGA